MSFAEKYLDKDDNYYHKRILSVYDSIAGYHSSILVLQLPSLSLGRLREFEAKLRISSEVLTSVIHCELKQHHTLLQLVNNNTKK